MRNKLIVPEDVAFVVDYYLGALVNQGYKMNVEDYLLSNRMNAALEFIRSRQDVWR